jgi:porphobilinogen synthase
VLIADVCLCEYTSHGHCGVVHKTNGDEYDVENDAFVELLAKTAASLAQAGADIVAPSDMMDGRVGRCAMSWMKRADAYADSELCVEVCFGVLWAVSRGGGFGAAVWRPAQLPDGWSECARGDARDRAGPGEGADMILMKPAMPYLDVIRAARERFDVPIGAYQVSGEYSMLQAAFARGWLEPERAMLESLLSGSGGPGRILL